MVGDSGQFFRRRYLIEQANPQSLLGVQQAAREQDVEGVSLAHQVHQAPHFPVADADAQAGGRNPKPAARGSNAQVGSHRQFAATAGGKAPNHRNGGRVHRGNGVQQPVHRPVIDPALAGVGTVLVKVRDVRPGGECHFAGAGNDHRPNLPIRIQFRQPVGQLAPHLIVDSVALAGTVDGDGGDGRIVRLAFYQNRVGVDLLCSGCGHRRLQAVREESK